MQSQQTTLLGADDPAPVERIAGAGPVFLCCEHAGQAVPAALRGLGVAQSALDDHIGWDIGAAPVTRLMAARLGAPAVLQRYSRLVIDCNRPAHAADAIPAVSDMVPIPGNEALSEADRDARRREIFAPYDAAVTLGMARPGVHLALSIHSFTPRLAREDRLRPWQIGFLCRADSATSAALAQAVARRAPGITVGINEPYVICDESDWFVPRHGERTGIPHSLIEIRNDLIRDEAGCRWWADLLSACALDVLETLK